MDVRGHARYPGLPVKGDGLLERVDHGARVLARLDMLLEPHEQLAVQLAVEVSGEAFKELLAVFGVYHGLGTALR